MHPNNQPKKNNSMSDYNDFEPASDFNSWFDTNQELINDMLRGDIHEVIYAAWFAGFGNGLEAMTEILPSKYSRATAENDKG
jgi:hypothetical protein